MKILFIASSYNSLSQRFYVELTQLGIEVAIHLTTTEQQMREAVKLTQPNMIICPFLKTKIPADIYNSYLCMIVHPGIKGDRGPSSLDWAILNEKTQWGVTLLQAAEEMDAGDIWSSHHFRMRSTSKSALYRNEVAQAAVKGLFDVLCKFKCEQFLPEPLNYEAQDVEGHLMPTMTQQMREINWLTDCSETIVRKIRAADSTPGVLDYFLFGEAYYLFGGHLEDDIRGAVGKILAFRDDAICVGTIDGSIWISHVKKNGYFKLPATVALKHLLVNVPESILSPFDSVEKRTYREIYYVEKEHVGYLHFNFYNGAMHTAHCIKLKHALIEAKSKSTKVLVLMGGHDFWSNGIHLNTIEHAHSPAAESWDNIHAMNDVVLEIMRTTKQLTISAIQGNAGAGGVILALAADYVYTRNGVILNPHYKKMGDLYGSEYWTYLLPKRVGTQKAIQITNECLPIGTLTAAAIGLIDDSFGETIEQFIHHVKTRAQQFAASEKFEQMLATKNHRYHLDEAMKPLASYRAEELRHMKDNFYGEDQSYHIARKHFVYKTTCETQPPLLQISQTGLMN